MNRFFLIFILSCLLISCDRCNNSFEEIILNNDKHIKLWNYYALEENESFRYLGYKYSFYSDGHLKIFYSKSTNEEGVDYENYDIHGGDVKRSWNFKFENKQLDFTRDSFIIEKYNLDTIIMRGKGFGGKFMMVRMKKKTNSPLPHEM